MNREIKFIVLHCTATPQSTTVASIQAYWRAPKPGGCGWKDPGYHHLITPDGRVHDLHPIDKPSNGVAGYNKWSLHISYIGGIDAKGRPVDNRTPRQIVAMVQLLTRYREQFPNARIVGHRDFPGVTKACPSFDVGTWLRLIGIQNPV